LTSHSYVAGFKADEVAESMNTPGIKKSMEDWNTDAYEKANKNIARVESSH
jgi:hypothetical protein